jgi:hypothetical protein
MFKASQTESCIGKPEKAYDAYYVIRLMRHWEWRRIFDVF